MGATITLYRPLNKDDFITVYNKIFETTDYIRTSKLYKYIQTESEIEESVMSDLAIVDDWIDADDRLAALYVIQDKRTKRSNRIKRYKDEFKKRYNDRYANTDVIVCEEIDFVSGWFFSKKLLHATYSFFYAFTKHNAEKLVIELIDYHGITDIERINNLQNRIKELLSRFEDGDILVMSW